MLKVASIPPIDLNSPELEVPNYPHLKLTKSLFTLSQIQRMAEDAKIDLEIDQPSPQNYLEVVQDGDVFPLFTGGNFSLVIGKAKSRKTFFVSSVMGAALQSGQVSNVFKANLPLGKQKVIFFDTEQGQYHVQKSARRVLSLAGEFPTDNFNAYSLRKFNPAERLIIIEHILYNTPGIGFVVIDGIRDLVTSINDEDQATNITSKLLKWTEELEIHIVGVLHQNKGDAHARGHLGSEAQNKAELVLSVTKENDRSIVEIVYCREREFEPIAFSIDEDGLPVFGEKVPRKSKETTSKADVNKLPIDFKMVILEKVFEIQPRPKYGELGKLIKQLSLEAGFKISDNYIRELIIEYKEGGILTLQGKERTNQACYVLNQPC